MIGYLRLVSIGYRRRLAYRGGVVSLIWLYALTFGVMVCFWRFIGAGTAGETMRGFTYPETITYLFLAVLIRNFVNSDLDIRLAAKISSGAFAGDLILPLNPILGNVAESIGTSLYMFTWGSLPIGAALMPFVPLVGTTLARLPAFAGTLVMAAAMNVYINYIAGLMSVWTRRIAGVLAIKACLTLVLSGTLVPIAFLPDWAASLARWSPFASLTHVPVLSYLGKLSAGDLTAALAVQLAWMLVLHVLAAGLWSKARKRYAAYGG